MPPKKKAKTSAAATKLDKKAGSIAGIGLTLAPNELMYLKCDNLSSMLRIVNITADVVEIPAAASVQRALGREVITGDELPNHLPVAWGQSDAVRFEIVRINSDLLPGGSRELKPEDIERMSDGKRQWKMEELMGMIETLPGSESKKATNSHYLGYRRSIWRALKHQTFHKTVEDADLILDVVAGKALRVPYTCQRDETAILVPEALGSASVAFVVPDNKKNKAKEQASTSGQSNEEEEEEEEGVSLNSFLKSIGTPGCVSLLQKIIRRRPASLVHPDTEEQIPANHVIQAVVKRLLDPQQPGIFLPDQGVYVSARQHFLKRLLVMMAEDSEFSDSEACLLASSALLLGCEPSWVPPVSLHTTWSEIAINLWRSPLASEYDPDKGFSEKPSRPTPFKPAEFPSLVLEELGGMRHDKGLMRWLRHHPRNTLRAESAKPVGVDPLDIFCDQHVSGNIVYLWCPRLKKGPARIPYGPELDTAFRLVSGVNPRRHRHSLKHTKAERSHIRAILKAMKHCSKIVRGIPTPFPKPDDPFEYEWNVPDGALAGMIGPVEVKVEGKTLVVTVDPTDLKRWVVIPKPSRSSNLKDISDDERKEGLEKAAEVLATGVKLRSTPHASLDGVVAKFSDDKWKVDGEDWEEKKKVTFSLVQCPKWKVPYDDLPFECPNEYSQEVLQWVAGRIGGYEPMVHMPTVARDGSGTKEALTGVESYSLLLKLSLKYPDALWPVGQFSFVTRCVPLRLQIRKKLLSKIQKKLPASQYPAWSDDRTLRPLQEEALQGMLRADAAGMGSFLWMLVGSGKSLTVLSFIHKTRRSSSTLWCLPMSAMKSVASEVRRAGWRVRVLSSSSGRLKQHEDWASKSELTLNTNLQAGTITLVEHDDVRNLVAALSPQMLFTTFVYDEVHKAMAAKTQRTGSALRLAQLAKQMVALTGTPIVDSRAFTLINWLRFCVPFQVHARNFWVAANSMIAKLTGTPVQIDRRTVQVPLSQEQRQAVDNLLPARLGGTARKPDYNTAYALSLKYVDEWVVNETLRVVYGARSEAPEGCPPGEGHAYAVTATRLLPPTEALFDHLPQRVLLVAADRNHGAGLVKALIAKGAPAKELMFIGGRARPDSLPSLVKHSATVCFTADEWRRGEWVPSICVAPISYCEGYSLTWMTTLISGVYPSNQSKRTQMEGRINRANCERLHRTYITAMAGLTEVMYKYQRNAKNLESALANLSKMKN